MSFLRCRFPPQSGDGTHETPPLLGFSDDEGYIGQRGEPGVAPGVQAPSRRAPGGGRARWPPGHPMAPLWLLFCVSSSSLWKMSSVDFQVFGGLLLQQLSVHFLPLNPASTASTSESYKLCKTSQNNI